MRVLPCGDTGVLLDCGSLAEAQSWFDALGAEDVVLGAQTVLVRGEPARLRALVGRTVPSVARSDDDRATVQLPVTYDGPDLQEVAALTGLTVAEVVAAHTGTPWTVGFGGFAPGFAYLVGGDPRLHVPRRTSPRTQVPAGSVGLAGDFSGVYPRESPGGWQLIGRTSTAVWDLARTPPALLLPGSLVRFVVA